MDTEVNHPYRPFLEYYSEKELNAVHSAALEILERTGSNVYHPEARELLYSAGARVENDLRVRIPSYLVEKALQAAPKQIALSNRLGKRTIILEGSRIYYGPGSDLVYTIDHETGEHRKTVFKDIENSARVGDFLGNLDFLMSNGLPSDIPPMIQELHEFFAMTSNSVKPMFITMSSGRKDMLEYMYDMGVAVTGSPEQLKANPYFAVYAEPAAPLKHGQDGLELLLFCSEHSIPVTYPSAVFAGANAPVTMPGAVAMCAAATLAGLVIHQLKNEGAPYIFGGGGVCCFDMRNVMWPYGAPEWHVGGAILAQLSRRYRLSTWSVGGCTDSKTVDEQAAIEGAHTLFMAALGGGNVIHDVGFLESGLTGSLSYMVMMNEAITMVKRSLRSLRVNRETIALDLIDEIGPDGDFFSTPHTLKNYKEELWYPDLFDRNIYDRWTELGSLTTGDRAKTEVKNILKTHKPVSLPEEVRKELEKILRSAAKKV